MAIITFKNKRAQSADATSRSRRFANPRAFYFLQNKKGAEIPIIIFTLAIIVLLFLVLLGASGSRNKVEQQAFSVTSLQEAYTLENAVTYIFDRVFDYSVVQAYYNYFYNTGWLYNCPRVTYNGRIYRELCSNINVDKEMEGEAKTKFINKLKLVKDNNELVYGAISQVVSSINKDDPAFKSIAFNNDEAKLEVKVLVGFTVNTEYSSWGKIIKIGTKTYLDYYFDYEPLIVIDKSLSEEVGLESFDAIYNAINNCKSLQNSEVQGCVNNLLKNFNANVVYDEKEKKLFFDLETKKAFSIENAASKETLKMNIYVDK